MTPESLDIIRRIIILEEGRKSDTIIASDRGEEILRRLGLMETAIIGLTDRTNRHMLVQTCVNGGKQALQYGGMGSGIVATVVLLGRLLGFW